MIAAAITSRLDKTRLPTHINIRAADTGLAKDSVVLLEQIRTLDKHRLRERAGQITALFPPLAAVVVVASHFQRKNDLNFRDTGASADAPVSHFHGKRFVKPHL